MAADDAEQLRKALAAHAPTRGRNTMEAPPAVDDEGTAAAARADLRRQRPVSRNDAPGGTLESALGQGSAKMLGAALARMPLDGEVSEAQRDDCRKLLALRPLPLDRYEHALASAAERERDAAYRRARARLRFVDGGELSGPDEFDVSRIGALAACSQLRAPRKRDLAAGRARYYFEASLRSAGAGGMVGWGRHEDDGSTTVVAALRFKGGPSPSWDAVSDLGEDVELEIKDDEPPPPPRRPRRTGGQHPNAIQPPPQRVAGCLYDAHTSMIAFSMDGQCVCACKVPDNGNFFPVCRAELGMALPILDKDEDEERKDNETPRGVRLNAGGQSFARDPEGLAAALQKALGLKGEPRLRCRAARSATRATFLRGVIQAPHAGEGALTLEVICRVDAEHPPRICVARTHVASLWLVFEDDRERAVCVVDGAAMTSPWTNERTGRWRHLAVSVDGDGVVALYGDGAPLDGAPCDALADRSEGEGVAFGLSCADDDVENPVCGAIAECRVWAQARSPRAVAARAGRGACAGDEPDLVGLWPLDEGVGYIARNCAVRAPPGTACAVDAEAWICDGDDDDAVVVAELPRGDPDQLDREAFPGEDDPPELTDALMALVTRARDNEGASPAVLAAAAHARTFQLASVALWAQRNGGDAARRLRADADDATRLVAGRPQLPAALPACAAMLSRSMKAPGSAAAALCAARWARAAAGRLRRSRASTREAALPKAVREELIEAAVRVAEGALGDDADVVRRHARAEAATLVADHADLLFDGVAARRTCLVRALRTPGRLAAGLAQRYAASPQLLSELVPPSLRPARTTKAHRLCTKAARDAGDDAKALSLHGVEYVDNAPARRGDVCVLRKNSIREKRTVGIVVDVEPDTIRVEWREGPRKRRADPVQTYPRGAVLLRRCSARRVLGPALLTDDDAPRCPSALKKRVLVDGLRLVATKAWLLRRRLVLEATEPIDDATDAPPDPRGDVARSRTCDDLLSLYEDACGEFGYWPARLDDAVEDQRAAELNCCDLFSTLIELLDSHAWARALFDALLAEVGADDDVAGGERFCGAPRLLARVACDLLVLEDQRDRALTALAAVSRFDAIDADIASEILAALAKMSDGPAEIVARVAGLCLAALARPPLLAIQHAAPSAFDESSPTIACPSFAAVKAECASVAAPLLNLGGAILEPAVEACWRACVRLGGEPRAAFAICAPGVRVWAKGRAAASSLEASAAHVVAASAAIASLEAQAAPGVVLREVGRADAAERCGAFRQRAARRASAALNRRRALGAALELYAALQASGAAGPLVREIAGAFRIRAQDEAATPPDEDALAYAQRAVETDGSFALLYQALGEDLLKGARAGDAVKGLLACFSGDPVVPPHTVETLVSVERALRDRGRHDEARAALATLFEVRAPLIHLLAASTAHAAKLPDSSADRACAAVCRAIRGAESSEWAPFCATVLKQAAPHGAARDACWRLAETLLRAGGDGEAFGALVARALDACPAAGPARAARAALGAAAPGAAPLAVAALEAGGAKATALLEVFTEWWAQLDGVAPNVAAAVFELFAARCLDADGDFMDERGRSAAAAAAVALAVAGVASDAGRARRARLRATLAVKGRGAALLRLAATPLAGVPGLGALACLSEAARDAQLAEKADAASVARLAEMGFDQSWCEAALVTARGDVDAALATLLGRAADAEAAEEKGDEADDPFPRHYTCEGAAIAMRSAPRRTAPVTTRLTDHDVVAVEQRGPWLRVRVVRRGGAHQPRDALYAAFQNHVALSTGSVASTDDDQPAAPALNLLRRGLDLVATPAALSAENLRRRLRSDGVVLGSGFTPPEQQRAPSEVSAAPSEMTANVSDVGELIRGRRSVREVTVQEELDDEDADQHAAFSQTGSIGNASAAPSVSESEQLTWADRAAAANHVQTSAASATASENATRTTALDASVAFFEPMQRRAASIASSWTNARASLLGDDNLSDRISEQEDKESDDASLEDEDASLGDPVPAPPPRNTGWVLAADLAPRRVRPLEGDDAPRRGPAPYPGLERDAGDEFYRRDDRFFGARHGTSPQDADACADGAKQLPRRAVRQRAARVAPNACWAALWRLRARELLLALVTTWAAGDDGDAKDARPLVDLVTDGDGAPREFAAFLALVLFRDWRPAWWPRDATSKALAGNRAAAPLSFDLRGALLPALLQRPTRLLLRHATFGPPLAEALADACRKHVGPETPASVSDKDACAALFGDDDGPLIVADDGALRGGRLPLAQWAARTLAAEPSIDLDGAFDAFALLLASDDLRLKQHACSELAGLLAQLQDRGDALHAAALARRLPRRRLENLARRRCLREAEDAPVHSRVCQSFVDLAARVDALCGAEPHGDTARFALALNGGEARIDINAGDAPPPWTAEYVLRRDRRDDAPEPPHDDSEEEDDDACEGGATWLAPVVLASSRAGADIRLQHGGAAFGDGGPDAPDEAACVSVNGQTFEYRVPTEKWVHLAFVCRERRATSTAALCPRAFDAAAAAPKHVVELFADGRLVGCVATCASLPLGAVGLTGGAPATEKRPRAPPARSPRCRVALARYWCVARTAADVRRSCERQTSLGAARGLLNAFRLAFDDHEADGWPANRAPNVVEDATGNHRSVALTEGASWVRTPRAPLEPVHKTHEPFDFLVARGTTARTAVAGVRVGVLARDKNEAFVLRLRRKGAQHLEGEAEWTERGLVCAVRGSLDGATFRVVVGDVLHGSCGDDSDDDPGRADDERACDGCCAVSPRDAVISGRRAAFGSWAGEVTFDVDAARKHYVGMPLLDEAALPRGLDVREVGGAFADSDDALRTPRRALVVAAASGGRFCGVASAPVVLVPEDDEEEVPACESSRARDDDAGVKAGDASLAADVAARACARKLAALDLDKPQAPLKQTVDAALELADAARVARARARRLNRPVADAQTCAERRRRQNAGPPPREVPAKKSLPTKRADPVPRGSSGGRTSASPVAKGPDLKSAKQTTRVVGEPPAGTLHVRIRDNVAAIGEETYFKVKWSTRMERVFQAYAVRKRSTLDELRFRVAGADCDVGMDETSTSLGLEDLALIDCFAKEPAALEPARAVEAAVDAALDAARAAAEASPGGLGEAPPSPPRPGRKPPASPKKEVDAEAKDLDPLSSSEHVTGTFGATSGVWCWEWEARRVASGGVGVGLVAAGHDPCTALGSSKLSPWCYRSCGALAGRGEVRSAPAFGAGDVISVELRIEGTSGSVRFYKNDVEAAANQATDAAFTTLKIAEIPEGGLRPACHAGGAGDALIWRGCKRGRATQFYAPEGDKRSFEGCFDGKTGARHGPNGVVRYRRCAGRWVGPWRRDRMHGVQLWVEPAPASSDECAHCDGDEIVAPVLFADGQRICALNDEDGGEAMRAYFASKAVDEEAEVKDEGTEEKEEVEEEEDTDQPPWTLRVVYREGATARRGVEIDASDVVGRVGAGEEVVASQRAVTADGVPRYLVKLPRNATGEEEAQAGWISERLRGGARDAVCVVLRHVVRGRPLRYRVVRPGGAMVRATPSLDGAEVGLAPAWTALNVAERVRLPGGTTRLRVVAPAKWAGWASEKDHILRREPSRAEVARAARAREARRRRRVRKAREDADRARVTRLERKRRAKRPNVELPPVKATWACCAEARHLLDRRECGAGIKVSEDLLTATCTAPRRGRGLALASTRMRTGRHYWEVQVERATWGSVFVGVAAVGAGRGPAAAPKAPGAGAGWAGVGFVNYRATQAFGAEALYGSYYGPGDIVGVLLDCDRGTLSFVKDGDDFNAGRAVVAHLGTAYSDVWRRFGRSCPGARAGLYACLGLKGDGDRLSLRNSKAWTDGERVPPLLDAFQRAAHGIEALRAFAEARRFNTALPDAFRAAAAAATATWRETFDGVTGKRVLARSRARVDVALDASAEAFEKALARANRSEAQLKAGYAVDAPHGAGVVLGCDANHRVWACVPGVDDDRAWYWTPEELACRLDDGLVAPADDTVVETGAWPAAAAEVVPFAWSAACDAELVAVIDGITARRNCAPALAPPSHVARALKFDASLACGRVGPLYGCPAGLIAARLGELLHLDASVSEALPFLDLSSGDAAAADLKGGSHYALADGGGGLAGTGPDAWWAGLVPQHTAYDAQIAEDTPALAALITPASKSVGGWAFVTCRDAVFDATKRKYWRDVLEATTTHTPPPPDEYDRPEELREFVVDRLRATKPFVEDDGDDDEAARLARLEHPTVFGQLRTQLKGVRPAQLRRAFVHMQDGGQPRAFYVKFVGEGVDDHGGPYRATFQAALADEPRAGLDLVTQGGALNASGNCPEAWFHHLGRLLGVAGRHRVPVALELGASVWAPLSGAPLSRDFAGDTDGAIGCALEECLLGNPSVDAVERLADVVGVMDDPKVLALHAAQKLAERQRPSLARFSRGAGAALPNELFALFAPDRLKDVICGESSVDLSDLQARATYEGGVCVSDEHVEKLWAALATFDADELAGFVEFCSGSARPPRRDAPRSTRALKITAPPPGAEREPDAYFPLSQTCFFSLALPRYSSAEICGAKLRYAITHAHLMDADFLLRQADGWEMMSP